MLVTHVLKIPSSSEEGFLLCKQLILMVQFLFNFDKIPLINKKYMISFLIMNLKILFRSFDIRLIGREIRTYIKRI
jgi:hypothetical protein